MNNIYISVFYHTQHSDTVTLLCRTDLFSYPVLRSTVTLHHVAVGCSHPYICWLGFYILATSKVIHIRTGIDL